MVRNLDRAAVFVKGPVGGSWPRRHRLDLFNAEHFLPMLTPFSFSLFLLTRPDEPQSYEDDD
jgi:hypothetical protein